MNATSPRSMMAAKPLIIVLAILTACALFFGPFKPVSRPTRSLHSGDWQFDPSQDGNSHSLSTLQREKAFPRLFDRIDDQVRVRTRESNWVPREDLEIPAGQCMLRVIVYEGELRIIDLGKPEDCYVSNGRERIMATLHLIQRAVTSTPPRQSLPNIEFTMSYDDIPARSTSKMTWGFTRLQSEQNVWLIPEYGYWSWWSIGLPSFKSIWRCIEELEASLYWQDKIPRAIWRGTTHLNPVVREKLVETANNTAWGDVKAVKDGEKDNDFVTLDEHCRYKFLLQAEGTSYSGRLKYPQLCKSVIVAHKIDWAEFATHLMQADGPQQDFVEVERDWSDLPTKLKRLIQSPEEAAAIAERSYELFNRRYLTPAGINCYLRRLFDNWAQVRAFEPEIFEDHPINGRQLRGMAFEALAVSFPQNRPGEFPRFTSS